MRNILFFFVTLCGTASWALETRYDSGLMRNFISPSAESISSEEEALSRFVAERFASLPEGTTWSLIDRTEDFTHVHLLFELRNAGRPFIDRQLKVHFNRRGWIDYATSTLEVIPFKIKGRWNWSRVQQQLLRRLPRRRLPPRMNPKEIIWIDEKGSAHSAFDVSIQNQEPFQPMRQIVDAETGKTLEDKKIARNVSANVVVYKKSPFGDAGAANVTIETEDAGKLQNEDIIVRRDQDPDEPTYVHVTPQDFTGGDFSSDPALYDASCTGNTNQCDNQGFDAVNVYYHLTNYRSRIDDYLATLGASVNFRYDPLNIVINSLHIDLSDSDVDSTNETNNALYLGEPCASDGSMERCILFLRPATLTGLTALANCGAAPAVLYDLAREAVVVAHEYQHYVTDMVSGIGFGTTSEILVGDIIHEGYSDYLGASYVSDLNDVEATLVGEYALQACSPLQREVGDLSIFDSVATYTSPHRPGLSWASAFWRLRQDLGMQAVDLLALKSQFFISTSPGFFDSVEAVVQADRALNNGVNESRIRRVFYDDVKWVGTLSGALKDKDKGVFEVGIKGCGAVRAASSASFASFVAFVLWLFGTLLLMRRRFSF